MIRLKALHDYVERKQGYSTEKAGKNFLKKEKGIKREVKEIYRYRNQKKRKRGVEELPNEITEGTNLGVVLIALAAIIGLGFGVFAIAKGIANDGVVNLQDNLAAVSDSVFQDYDQTIVTGTQVKSAYKTFQGKPVAVLVRTQAMAKSVKTHKDHTTGYLQTIGKENFMNYNALLSNESTGTLPLETIAGNDVFPGGEVSTGSVIVVTKGVAATNQGFALDTSGKVQYDPAIVGMSKAGNSEFISPNAKFDTYLVKDASGTNVGVVFKQIAK